MLAVSGDPQIRCGALPVPTLPQVNRAFCCGIRAGPRVALEAGDRARQHAGGARSRPADRRSGEAACAWAERSPCTGTTGRLSGRAVAGSTPHWRATPLQALGAAGAGRRTTKATGTRPHGRSQRRFGSGHWEDELGEASSWCCSELWLRTPGIRFGGVCCCKRRARSLASPHCGPSMPCPGLTSTLSSATTRGWSLVGRLDRFLPGRSPSGERGAAVPSWLPTRWRYSAGLRTEQAADRASRRVVDAVEDGRNQPGRWGSCWGGHRGRRRNHVVPRRACSSVGVSGY